MQNTELPLKLRSIGLEYVGTKYLATRQSLRACGVGDSAAGRGGVGAASSFHLTPCRDTFGHGLCLITPCLRLDGLWHHRHGSIRLQHNLNPSYRPPQQAESQTARMISPREQREVAEAVSGSKRLQLRSENPHLFNEQITASVALAGPLSTPSRKHFRLELTHRELARRPILSRSVRG